MNQITTKYFDMPATIKAYTVHNKDDTYTIILNSRLSHEQLMDSYKHEIDHIENGDYERNHSNIIEVFSHI